MSIECRISCRRVIRLDFFFEAAVFSLLSAGGAEALGEAAGAGVAAGAGAGEAAGSGAGEAAGAGVLFPAAGVWASRLAGNAVIRPKANATG